MRKHNLRLILTDEVETIIRLSENNLEREPWSMSFHTTSGDRKTLSLNNIFRNNEINLKCLSTKDSPQKRFNCRFRHASDLGRLVQLFSWNSKINTRIYMGDTDFPEQKAQLLLFNNLDNIENSGKFIITQTRGSMSFSLELDDGTVTGTIIDFMDDSNGISPRKIFGMTVPAENKSIDVFYISPQDGHECFNLATSLIERHL